MPLQPYYSDFPETLPGVKFDKVSERNAIALLYKSVLNAYARNAFKMEESVVLYPALETVYKLLNRSPDASAANAPASAKAGAAAQPAPAAAANRVSPSAQNKTVKLAPTVTQKITELPSDDSSSSGEPRVV